MALANKRQTYHKSEACQKVVVWLRKTVRLILVPCAERKKFVVNLQELLGAKDYTAAKIKERTNISPVYEQMGRKEGKMFAFLLIVLAILIFMLGFSLLAAHIVAIHRMGGRGY